MITPIKAGHAIHIDQLIYPLEVVSQSVFIGRAHNAQAFQVNTFDQIGPLDIEAGDKTNISQK
jgi:hypothetical protein